MKIADNEIKNKFYQSHTVTEKKLKFIAHQGERALINWGPCKRSFLGWKAHHI